MLNVLSLLLPIVFAKTISTPYLDFEVPESYTCTSQDAYYQCQDSTGPRMKDSILVITFKRAGPQDTVEQYHALLSKPFTRTNPSGGPPALSKLLSIRKVQIKDWEWVEAKHFESDLTNYNTSYWATARGSVAMVVKYSALAKKESGRQADIRMISQSLQTKNVRFSPPAPTSPHSLGGVEGPATAAPTATMESKSFVQKMMSQPPLYKYLIAAALIITIALAFYAIASSQNK